jgi:hypothetical protein
MAQKGHRPIEGAPPRGSFPWRCAITVEATGTGQPPGQLLFNAPAKRSKRGRIRVTPRGVDDRQEPAGNGGGLAAANRQLAQYGAPFQGVHGILWQAAAQEIQSDQYDKLLLSGIQDYVKGTR